MSEARSEVKSREPDLILLDLGLPDVDGLQLCRELRGSAPASVLVVLTVRRDEVDVVLALDAGADDYLTTPFRLRELFARINAHLRRAEATSGVNLVAGNLVLQPEARRAFVNGRELELRSKEFDLLLVFAERTGLVVRRDELMSEIWDAHWSTSPKTLHVHVSSLRRKLAEAGWSGQVVTLRGVGYRLEAP